MSNTFDINRFGKLLRKDATDFFPNYGLTLVIFACIPIALWLLTTIFSGEVIPVMRWGVIGILFYIACMVGPEKIYGKANLPKEGNEFAMTPASSLEKFLSMMFFCLIVTPVLFLAGSLLIDTILTILPFGSYAESLFSTNFANLHDMSNPNLTNTELAHIVKMGIWTGFLGFLSLVAKYMFGNMLFKSHKTVKTIAVLLVIAFIFQTIASTLFMLNPGFLPQVFAALDLNDQMTEEVGIRMTEIGLWIILTLNAIVAAACYFGTYLKIKTQKY
jgi:hypothetical protein